MDTLLNRLKIKHYKIRPRTPEHNGKVERSHRNDNERFYSYLKFYSLEDLIRQGKAYLKRSNNIPMAVLGYLTPKEKKRRIRNAMRIIKINSIYYIFYMNLFHIIDTYTILKKITNLYTKSKKLVEFLKKV